MKQSSIDWLIENLAMAYPKVQEMRLVDKAKAMHREEIVEAHLEGFNTPADYFNAEIYYNATFNQPTNP